jgi:hypothetical protein
LKTHHLDNTSDEHFDFDVFSITCLDSIYRVIRELNSELALNFELSDLLDYTHDAGEDFFFPLFTYFHNELNIEFNLIPNQTSFKPKDIGVKKDALDLFGGNIEQTIKLLPELENTDYLLIIKGDNRYLHNHSILVAIKKIKSFITCREIFVDDIKDKKSKSNLLF